MYYKPIYSTTYSRSCKIYLKTYYINPSNKTISNKYLKYFKHNVPEI